MAVAIPASQGPGDHFRQGICDFPGTAINTEHHHAGAELAAIFEHQVEPAAARHGGNFAGLERGGVGRELRFRLSIGRGALGSIAIAALAVLSVSISTQA